MCVDCVLASPRIAQADPGNGPLPEVVLSHKGHTFHAYVLMSLTHTLLYPSQLTHTRL
jgi:hypothetical protein